MIRQPNRYAQLIEHIFDSHYTEGATEVVFEREEIQAAAQDLGIVLPKNLGDLIYSFRYRTALPFSVQAKAPPGHQWVIRSAGRSRYRFVATTAVTTITPDAMLSETKVPDATPGVIAIYALSDEQALLARLRYNRLIDIFTGVACYSLQNHLRTQIRGVQVETDEIYVGVDRRGMHYVFPVQAKGGKDRLSVVQIEQDLTMCAAKFPKLGCRPIAAQFMADHLIALFEFEESEAGVRKLGEKHYRLVPPEELTPADLEAYSRRTD